MLIAAIPFAVAEFIKTGEFYLLSQRFFDDLTARVFGPGRLRFILQPIIAIALGMRDGAKDSHERQPPFLWGLLFHSADRAKLLRSAIASVRNLVAVAILADVVAQFLILGWVNPFAALLLGPVLIALPYSLSRALSNRASQWRRRGSSGRRATVQP